MIWIIDHQHLHADSIDLILFGPARSHWVANADEGEGTYQSDSQDGHMMAEGVIVFCNACTSNLIARHSLP